RCVRSGPSMARASWYWVSSPTSRHCRCGCRACSSDRGEEAQELNMADDFAIDARLERRPKLSERVVAAIRQQIVSGAFPAGQKLPTESKLTDRFGVSRTVIREAMASLAADGLVEPRQGAGVFVLDRPIAAFGQIG